MHRALLLSALVLAACGEEKTDTGNQARIDAVLALTGDATNGGTVFGNTCAGCHGADGASGSAPDLTAEIPEVDDAELVEIMLFGEGTMPAQDLTDQDAADVLAYARVTFP